MAYGLGRFFLTLFGSLSATFVLGGLLRLAVSSRLVLSGHEQTMQCEPQGMWWSGVQVRDVGGFGPLQRVAEVKTTYIMHVVVE